MIPMSCPQCGSQGEIPLDKLNTRLHCRKCGVFFYVETSGQVHLGDPPNAAAQNESILRQARKKPKPERAEIDLNPFQGINAPSRRTVAVAGLVLGVAALIAGAVMVVKTISQPEDLSGRAIRVAEMFTDMRLTDLETMATKDDVAGLKLWYNAVRPRFPLKEPRKTPEEVGYSNMILNESKTAAETTTIFNLRASSDADKTIPQVFSYPLIWKQEDSQWKVDFPASLQRFRQMELQMQKAEQLRKIRERLRGTSKK